MKFLKLFAVTFSLVFLACLVPGSFRVQAEAAEDQTTSTQWIINQDELDGLTVLGVSPSGQYIAAADRISMDLEQMYAAGVVNPLGRIPDAICLFVRDGEHYHLEKTIPIDTEAQLELSSLIGGGCALAWNDAETRIAIAGDMGLSSGTKSYIGQFRSNLYVLDINDGTFQRLTQNENQFEHSVMPQWAGNDVVRFLKIAHTDGSLRNTLYEIDLTTGEEKKLADLYSAGGRICPVLYWQIVGEEIYYTTDDLTVAGVPSGLFKSPIGGSEADAVCLIDFIPDLRDTGRHPYGRLLALFPQGISSDGKWACLSIYDQRVIILDIPFADNAENPQSDPANAISPVTYEPWVPCHNILLYDLEAGQIVDPFIDEALDPAKVIVTGACLAPDGKSLLCAVFGDGGPWTLADQTRTTFYRIDLTDGNFTAERLFENELNSSLWFPEGIRWLDNNILCIPTGTPPDYPVQMIQSPALEQADNEDPSDGDNSAGGWFGW